jgi:uncharacterized ParB-like nuclease family protein
LPYNRPQRSVQQPIDVCVAQSGRPRYKFFTGCVRNLEGMALIGGCICLRRAQRDGGEQGS